MLSLPLMIINMSSLVDEGRKLGLVTFLVCAVTWILYKHFDRGILASYCKVTHNSLVTR